MSDALNGSSATKKSKKAPNLGVTHVKSTFNNTIINITDKQTVKLEKEPKDLITGSVDCLGLVK